ncbi:uncharacterized, partial [Tachysurus ichikawai]
MFVPPPADLCDSGKADTFMDVDSDHDEGHGGDGVEGGRVGDGGDGGPGGNGGDGGPGGDGGDGGPGGDG